MMSLRPWEPKPWKMAEDGACERRVGDGGVEDKEREPRKSDKITLYLF